MSEVKSDESVLRHFFFNYKAIVIDEIALEGLEGVGLDLLWRRVEHRISQPVTQKMKERIWHTIHNCHNISFYKLPEALPYIEIRDRFTIVDPDNGDLTDPCEHLDGPYTYSPVQNEYGSCKYFESRLLIPKALLENVPYENVVNVYGDLLVMVASIEERWHSLAQHVPINYLQQLMPLQYCVLELIGKSRANGQTTTGTSNLITVIKEPKNLFYVRKCLKNLNLIRALTITQSTQGIKGSKSILLRLNRFYTPRMMTLPKVGKIHDIVNYLKEKPNYAEKADVLCKIGLLSRSHAKRLRKTNNIFGFEDNLKGDDGEPKAKRIKLTSPSMVRQRKYIFISPESDESSLSDEEPSEEPIKCEFKIGIGLMRQAYERFLEAGTKGLSQFELASKLGIEFYTCRMLCRLLKSRKIVREFFEDKGKQRLSRYIAVAAGLSDAKYAEQKNKFLEYINQTPASTPQIVRTDALPPDPPSDVNSITPITLDLNLNQPSTSEENNTDLKVYLVEENTNSPSILNPKKSLTLRQLTFANGLLKVIREKLCVTGYQTLSNLVSKETGEPPMVTKALKTFLQKLVAMGQVKVYKVKWRGVGHEYNILNMICAPHIKPSDPIVISKYKEVYLKALANKPTSKKDTSDNVYKPLSMFVHPRYMKIQNLHEYLMKVVYFEPVPNLLPKGCFTVTDLMPELTVKSAINFISNTGMAEIAYLRIQNCHLDLKLRDAPPEIAQGIMKSKSLRNAFRMNLKALAMCGLIQLILQPDIHHDDYTNSTLGSFLFYMNRRVKIINTTGIWPRPNTDIKSLEKSYYFKRFDDVENFWKDVYDISVGTKVMAKNRPKKTLHPPVRKQQEVDKYDNGDRYGDGMGPCGFDSCFYMDIPRLWRTFYLKSQKKSYKQLKPTKKPPSKVPKLPKTKQAKPPSKKKVPKVKSIIKLKTKTIPKTRKRITESTVAWTKEEDNIIMMCKGAITIASPTSQPGCLRIRNNVAKDILTINDPKKTQSVCHRRALMLQSNPTMMHEKESLLNEMKRRHSLIHKYEGLIRKLRLRYSTNLTKYMNEARLPILELVWLFWKVSTSESFNKKLPCVAVNFENFHETFDIVPATANKMFNMYKSSEYPQLRESVFLSIMLTYNNEIKRETATKIYDSFKAYPENVLRIVIEHLRKSGAVSAKEKLLNNQMHRMHFEDIVHSAYKVSANYQRRWIGRLNSEFIVNLGKTISGNLLQHNIKGSAEWNCVFSELQSINELQLVTETVPAIVDSLGICTSVDEQLSVQDIETKFKLKSGTVSWTSKPGNYLSSTRNASVLYKNVDLDTILKDMDKIAVVYVDPNQEYNMEDTIIKHLNEKGDNGAKFQELLVLTGYSTNHLIQRLKELESENILRRVGLNENILILVKYIEKWSMHIDDKYLIVTPWILLDGRIRLDIFFEWTSVLMNKIFENPGSSIAHLSDSFEVITCRAVQDACMFLERIKCVSLQILKHTEPDLFSDEEQLPEFTEFNPYEEAMYIIANPLPNSITKYAYTRKILLEKYNSEKA